MNISSMTGFGRSRQILNGREITAECKSVNNRFLDLSVKTPRSLSYTEEKLRLLFSGKVARGKVEFSLTVNSITASEVKIAANLPVIAEYLEALRNLQLPLDLSDDLKLSHIIRLPDAFTQQKAEVNEETLWQDVCAVATAALEQFLASRSAEGERLRHDLMIKADELEQFVATVKALSPQTEQRYRDRLFAKMKEILADKQIDEQRLLTEAAVFADKIAVDEEVTRLSAHIASAREMLTAGGAVGRKLDFLVQEINREINTIGSKAQDLQITQLVVNAKSELEKFREQIQNLE
jgi:uncharacterized protein (TIGR00255 family)